MSIFNVIKEVLEERNWKYHAIGNEIVMFDLNIVKPIRTLKYVLILEEDCYTVLAGIPVDVDIEDKEQKFSMMEFLNRASYGMKKGNFEFDTQDGEVRFKIHVDCSEIEPSKKMVVNSIDVPAKMLSLYGKGIIGIILGGFSAEEAFEQTEGKLEIERQRMMEEKTEENEVLSESLDSIYEEFPEWDAYRETHVGEGVI